MSPDQEADLLPLASALKPLKDLGADASYWRLWTMATSGDVPALRVGNAWLIRRPDLPTIAAAIIKKTSRTPTPTKPAA
jgi:hypothetical protein